MRNRLHHFTPAERLERLKLERDNLERSLQAQASPIFVGYGARSHRNAMIERQQMNIRLGEVRAEIRQFERAR